MRDVEQNAKKVAKDIIDLNTPDSFRWVADDNRGYFEAIFRFYQILCDADLAIVPDRHLQELAQTSRPFFDALRQFKSVIHQEPQSAMRLIRERWDQAYKHAVSEVLLILLLEGKIDTLLAETRSKGEQIHSQGTQLVQNVKGTLGEISTALKAAEQAAADAATASHAREFEFEAVASNSAAKRWLISAILSGAVAIALTWQLFLHDSGSASPVAAGTNSVAVVSTAATEKITIHEVQQMVARVVMVSIFYFFVILCGRNYSSCRHNYTVNRHRRNAMQTFKAFAAASSDPATREFMLRQAAACAFTPQQTGYLKDESLPEPPPLLVDATRLAGGKD